tara:strand:- start:159 stop:512 length:354 start_codon:yes stop_codon:yes gene_type:complete
VKGFPEMTTIQYQGLGECSELWGGTQADFVLDWPGRPAREVAVFLQDAAAGVLAEVNAFEDNSHFRAAAARVLGEAWLEAEVERQGQIDSFIVISAATLADRPELIAAARVLSSSGS